MSATEHRTSCDSSSRFSASFLVRCNTGMPEYNYSAQKQQKKDAAFNIARARIDVKSKVAAKKWLLMPKNLIARSQFQ